MYLPGPVGFREMKHDAQCDRVRRIVLLQVMGLFLPPHCYHVKHFSVVMGVVTARIVLTDILCIGFWRSALCDLVRSADDLPCIYAVPEAE